MTYLGPDTPVAMMEEAAATVKPRLMVVAAVMPGCLHHHADELAGLAQRWATAVGGAGTSPELAERLGVRHLIKDPVSAASELLE